MNTLATTAGDYRIETIDDLAAIGEAAWDGLVRASTGRLHPALRYAFLHGLHATGCATVATGWEPCYLVLKRGADVIASAPLYRKHHSYGEYVFDWAWAEAYHKHGLDYYPKLLCAIPFTPVGASKLLAVDDAARELLANALLSYARSAKLSSLHVLFADESERDRLIEAGCATRRGVQFHWNNRGYASFDEFLSRLEGPKRKKIRAERRKVAEAGVTLRAVLGSEATAEDWSFFSRCYEQTYYEHRSTPYLNAAFFERMGSTMGDSVLLVIAERGGRRIAATLSLFDETTLYGRYWGALEHVPCLHFEACYYTPIEFCIARGIACFEGGAQGEHKLARGFEPAEMGSVHWLAHPMFADAVDRFLRYESVGIGGYLDELDDRSPYRMTNDEAGPT